MSKRTPGPYFFDQMICSRRPDGSLVPTAIPAAHWSHDEVTELVDLLNKGTHFDDMLDMLKLMASGKGYNHYKLVELIAEAEPEG